MMHNKLHVSTGNSKLGKRATANISLLPVVTCKLSATCAKSCYARLACRNKSTAAAWMDNTAYAINDPRRMGMELMKWLDAHPKVKFFRFHVGGDAPNQLYAEFVVKDVVAHFPSIQFLIFTKKDEIDWHLAGRTLPNLVVYYSAWPDTEMPTKEQLKEKGVNSVAYIEGDDRIPEGTSHCKGRCDACRFCWNMGQDVVLHKH